MEQPKIITPTVGRQVWFYPDPQSAEGGFTRYNDGPFAATVVFVHGDRMVNLSVLDHAGKSHARTSIHLVQPGDEGCPAMRCEWMPFQKGQAAKTEALEQRAGGADRFQVSHPSESIG